MIPRHQGTEPSIWQIAGLQDQLHRAADRLRDASNEADYRTWLLDLRDGLTLAPGNTSVPVAVSQLNHCLDEVGHAMGLRVRRQMVDGLLREFDGRQTVAL